MALEVAARVVVPRASAVEARTLREYGEFVAKRNPSKTTICMVGNSLLGEGIDLPALRRELGAKYEVRRLVVEDTTYHDWYFGLTRLYTEGARCDGLVVVMSARQLLWTGVRGDYFAHRLMRFEDIPAVASNVTAGSDQTISFALAHISAFWGLRTIIRQWTMGRILHRARPLAALLASEGVDGDPREESLGKEAKKRLRALRALADSKGNRLVLLVPPMLSRSDALDAVTQGGRAEGVEVLMPVAPGGFPPTYFADGFHLNRSGAHSFTRLVAASMTQSFPARRERHPVAE